VEESCRQAMNVLHARQVIIASDDLQCKLHIQLIWQQLSVPQNALQASYLHRALKSFLCTSESAIAPAVSVYELCY